jgi:hypothetical protein
MTLAEVDRLARECEVFGSYLTGSKPQAYALEKYFEAHRKVASYTVSDQFDRFLLRFATTGSVFTKLADSYARLFAPASIFRRKLILLLAILESSSPAHRFLDSVNGNSKPLLFLQILQKGLLFVLSFLSAAIVLLPFHLLLGLAGRSVKGGR